jgi:hypothetical protein
MAPVNACGVSYANFRSGWTFTDAAEMLGARGGAKYRPSRRRVLWLLGKLKREAYDEHVARCAAEIQPSDYRVVEYASRRCKGPKGRFAPMALCERAAEEELFTFFDEKIPDSAFADDFAGLRGLRGNPALWLLAGTLAVQLGWFAFTVWSRR